MRHLDDGNRGRNLPLYNKVFHLNTSVLDSSRKMLQWIPVQDGYTLKTSLI
jgi:hypothetical protein